MMGLSGFTVVSKLNQEPPKQPFVSMLRPRAHEISIMSEEKGRRRVRRQRRPKTTPKGCLNYLKIRAT
jgi:hypothetical protein